MIFHDNCLLADDSHEISFLIFFKKNEKMSQNLSSAAVVIGALRAKKLFVCHFLPIQPAIYPLAQNFLKPQN